MSAPRHLWSGDWQDESSALSEELAARRARATKPAVREPAVREPAAREPAAREPAAREPAARERAVREPAAREPAAREPAARAPEEPSSRRPAITRRHLRLALVIAAMTLTAVAAAYAVASTLSGGGTSTPAAATSHSRAWLGVDTSSAAVGGVTVDSVERGSPAAAAGIKPGDVITALDTQPIATPAILLSAIDGMQPGERVELQLRRGGTAYTADVVLASRPGRSP